MNEDKKELTDSVQTLEEQGLEQEKTEQNEAESLREEIATLRDKLLRCVADSENSRKRFEKEKEDLMKYCVSSFAKDILTIRDNLVLALDNYNPENSESITDGIRMTLSEMDKTLKNHGISKVESLHSVFDPNFHQAVLEIPTEDKESGTVVQVIQEGFYIKERLLRPALVGVSKKP